MRADDALLEHNLEACLTAAVADPDMVLGSDLDTR